jgi:formylglycine-generating enzyme required for sulfatase activity
MMRRLYLCLVFVFFLVLIAGCSNDDTNNDKNPISDNIITSAEDLLPAMVKVGDTGVTYTFPTGQEDNSNAEALGGFYIATYETTYELWYHVRKWAEANDYFFRNCGDEGSQDISNPSACAAPTTRKDEPVTNINWRDTIVWLNALSELEGLEPVYRTPSGTILKDARTANSTAFEDVEQTNNNGYRLPTPQEWEMAARWRTTSGNGALSVGSRYWSPGSYVSGATESISNTAMVAAYAWLETNSNGKTQDVGQKNANALNLYDMSGNVSEWTFRNLMMKFIYGGNFTSDVNGVRVSVYSSYFDDTATNTVGFRIAKGS